VLNRRAVLREEDVLEGTYPLHAKKSTEASVKIIFILAYSLAMMKEAIDTSEISGCLPNYTASHLRRLYSS
jgi:hypothetical protein